MPKQKISVLAAVLAAALYAISAPVSKILLSGLSATLMAALLYLGAGLGMSAVGLVRHLRGRDRELRLTKSDLPFVIGMVALDIAAPVCLMIGLDMTTAANASLLNNFEIVTTAIIALMLFKEKVTKRLWLGIGLITLSSLMLSFRDMSSLSFSAGSLFVILACVCWGFENNCTRRLSSKDPLQIVVIKGVFSGLGALAIAFGLGEVSGSAGAVAAALLLGFVAYGLSIYFYVYAQRGLGAAKTSVYYAVAPFIGVAISFLIFREIPGVLFFAALAIMVAGAYFASTDRSNSGLFPK